jgi:hypothetical protein
MEKEAKSQITIEPVSVRFVILDFHVLRCAFETFPRLSPEATGPIILL